jgi:hypothetical protein
MNDRNISALIQARAAGWHPTRGAGRTPRRGRHALPRGSHRRPGVKLGAEAVGSIPTEPAEIPLCVREELEMIARGPAFCTFIAEEVRDGSNEELRGSVECQ